MFIIDFNDFVINKLNKKIIKAGYKHTCNNEPLDMLHILTKVKIVIMSIIDSIRICVANSNESEIILIHFINKQIIKAGYKHI